MGVTAAGTDWGMIMQAVRRKSSPIRKNVRKRDAFMADA
jgi:hypothetical protein